MDGDNTTQAYFARNSAVNTDINFAECGSFWHQLLKGKTRQAAKTMSKMPMLSSAFTDVNNSWVNIYNDDKNLYLTNREYFFKLSDVKFLICDNADSVDLNTALNAKTSKVYNFNVDALTLYLSEPAQFSDNQSIVLLIPFDSSDDESELKDLELFSIQSWDHTENTSNTTFLNVFYAGVHFRQSEKYVGFLLPLSAGLTLSDFTDTSKTKSERANLLWDFFLTHFKYDGINGSFIYNAKVRGQNKYRKSIYNAIIGLSNIPIGIEALQASNYVKGSDQSVVNFGKTLNAMFGGTAVDFQCDLTAENIANAYDLGNGFYAYKLVNTVAGVPPFAAEDLVMRTSQNPNSLNNVYFKISVNEDAQNPQIEFLQAEVLKRTQPQQYTIITKGKTNISQDTTLYPGDYLVNPINVYYNNGKDYWWDPSRTNNTPGACWTTENIEGNPYSIGLPFDTLSSSWKILWDRNPYTIDYKATGYVTYVNRALLHDDIENYNYFYIAAAYTNSTSMFLSYPLDLKRGVNWKNEKLQYLLNDYTATTQLDWFFKYIISNAVIIEINIEVLKSLYDNISKILNAIQQAGVSLCPIGMIPIFKINKGNYQWVDPRWYTPDS